MDYTYLLLLAIILLSTKVLGLVTEKIHMPQVVGALLAGIMFFWVLKKETALDAVNEGSDKKIGGWFHPFGKWVYVPLCIIALVAGAALGGIG